jgi:hypothetical protein
MNLAKSVPIVKSVATVEELIAATKDTGVNRIVVRGDLAEAPSIRLSPEQSLQGEGDEFGIAFSGKADGLQLSSDTGFTTFGLMPSRTSAQSSKTRQWIALGGLNSAV